MITYVINRNILWKNYNFEILKKQVVQDLFYF